MSTVPSRFGPYELESRLGAGGMAETFLAVRRGPGGFEQHLCLKRILPAFEADQEFVRLFLEEARIAARLRHTNIVQVLDFGVVEGSHFLALELVEGLDMYELLKRLRQAGEAMTSGLVSYLAFELGAGLDFAHAAGPDGVVKGVVHRDVSPSNVLLSTAGEVKLTDFGIAKAMNKTSVTKSGVIKGKVPYMAPEYALKMQFDARSDLFALGVTLYEALAGRRPYDGVTDLDTLRRIQDGEHTPLGEVVPSAPKGLVDAIERLIHPDPNERFDNAAELLDALVDVAPPPTARRILGELVSRTREATRGEPPVTKENLGYAKTQHATPSGTALVGSGSDVRPDSVRPAPSDAETRTRLPEGPPPGAAPVVGSAGASASGGTTPGRPSARPGAADASTPGGTAPGRPSGRPLGAADDSTPEWSAPGATQLDPDVAEAHALAGAATRPLPGAADATPIAPVATTEVPRRDVPAWAWVSLALLLAAGSAAAAWVTAQNGEGDASEVETATQPTEPLEAEERGAEPTEATAAVAPAAIDDTPAEPEPEAETEQTEESQESQEARAEEPRSPRTRTRMRQGPRPTPTMAERADPPPDTETPAPTAMAAPEPREDRPRATLEVVVIPFGDVWIDGRHVGTSPVTERLPAGRYVVTAGDGEPDKRQAVTLSPGQRRRVVLR